MQHSFRVEDTLNSVYLPPSIESTTCKTDVYSDSLNPNPDPHHPSLKLAEVLRDHRDSHLYLATSSPETCNDTRPFNHLCASAIWSREKRMNELPCMVMRLQNLVTVVAPARCPFVGSALEPTTVSCDPVFSPVGLLSSTPPSKHLSTMRRRLGQANFFGGWQRTITLPREFKNSPVPCSGHPRTSSSEECMDF